MGPFYYFQKAYGSWLTSELGLFLNTWEQIDELHIDIG